MVERQARIDVDALDDPSVPPPAELASRQESLRDRVAADEHAGEQLPGRGHDGSLTDAAPSSARCPQVPKSGFWH
jgi:hypothetical protein